LRTPFQRDRDRIAHSKAFRRLRLKTQVFVDPEGDHFRTRLTHTLETTGIARGVARALRLNEDLVEAVALAHDLGQPPFGPAGERALDDLLSGCLDGRGGPGLGDVGGFSRPWQSLRVVDLLEKRYDHPGLNLTDDVREGIFRSGGAVRRPAERLEGIRAGKAPGLEAQVVALADRIASALADLDDALQAGTLELAEAERLRAVEALRKKLGERYPRRAGRFVKANAIHRGLTHLFVTSAILESAAALARESKEKEILVDLPRSTARLLEDLEAVLAARVRRGREADRIEGWGRRVLLGLHAAYHADPSLLEDHVLFRFKEATGVRYLRDLPRETAEEEVRSRYRSSPVFARGVGDYLAGMTDAFALAEHERLLRMGAVPMPSAEQLRREERGGPT
jgi:dGTPase